MKILKKINDIFITIVSHLEMILVACIIGIMLSELALRNFANKSFRSSTELCGFLFMWMAFLGITVLYDKDRLITLDMIYRRVPENVKTIFWFINKIFSIGLGIIMIVAYQGMYKINSTSYFSTMQWLSKAWHFLPMAIAGGYLVFRSLLQIAERLTGDKDEMAFEKKAQKKDEEESVA